MSHGVLGQPIRRPERAPLTEERADSIPSCRHQAMRLGTMIIGTMIGAFSCSSPTASRPLPSIRITNNMCDAGTCGTLEIRAFIWEFKNIPQPPYGLRVLAEIPPGTSCVSFPSAWVLQVIGQDSAGRADTTVDTWTPSDSLPIYLIAVDSAAFHRGSGPGPSGGPYDGFAPGSVGETANFRPDTAQGWSASFPGNGGSLTSAGACTK